MNFTAPFADDHPLLLAIGASRYTGENQLVSTLLPLWAPTSAQCQAIQKTAFDLVMRIRNDNKKTAGLDAFLQEFSLSSQEGVALMCLAEALLRIPDKATVDRLIRDKIGDADWASHLGRSASLLVNASTWALMLTGRIIKPGQYQPPTIGTFMQRLAARNGKPVVRAAITRAMRIMGQQFVLGEDIHTALSSAEKQQARGYRYSYDMLGEAACTNTDAVRYWREYASAIDAIGKVASTDSPILNPGISIKLSALHARYEFAKMDRVIDELYPRLHTLACKAMGFHLSMTIDAEESDRLEISLALLEKLAYDSTLKNWDGLGLAVQAYQKRAPAVIDWLVNLAGRSQHRLMVRLVKGAYWDTEIKRAQEMGLGEYPVFTRKASTDLCYLVCAKKMLVHSKAIYPQFATHNAYSVAALIQLGNEQYPNGKPAGLFEFQCLHGMGEALYRQVRENADNAIACRIYAPVGPHKNLLAYLVRRLMENGANNSFVNRLSDLRLPIEDIIKDPAESLRECNSLRHPGIPLPVDLFAGRKKARGVDLSDTQWLNTLGNNFSIDANQSIQCKPMIVGKAATRGDSTAIINPANLNESIGTVICANDDAVEVALHAASKFTQTWEHVSAQVRAATLERAADLVEAHYGYLISLCMKESGKTVKDAVAEVREAVDFMRYYAQQARLEFTRAEALPGPTGESNQLSLHGRGVFLCISPWNFPLAIFCGQVSAALAAGNCVIAKPAGQTPLIAAFAVKLLHEAGIPAAALQFLPGDGAHIGAKLVADKRINGVAFTGSTETAWHIQRSLAERGGPIVPFIAETGGQNTLLVDATALPEHVVRDALASAFQSAGQRCSALRVMYLQNEIADVVLSMLCGAMDELETGDPVNLSTDIGPLIDASALAQLNKHLSKMRERGHFVYRAPDSRSDNGYFFPPTLVEIDNINELKREVFGPILHVVRYDWPSLETILDQINATGYGLTLGIHSRIDETVAHICQRVRVGNIYVNRNIIGAVVGSQPFGGEGLSGTGPKAGGPRYLHRFATERTISIDTTAVGGNASLMSID